MNIYNNLRGINVDTGAKCTLECPACTRQRNRDLAGEFITLDQVKKLGKFFNQLVFCGQISDPMVHPNMPPILKYCYENDISVEMHVAASQKKEEYWRKCFEANPKARWCFGLDGLPHKSHLYRINQDGEKLFDMMLIAKYEYNIRVSWMHILFAYNENDIDEVRALAKLHRIELVIKKSGRFYDIEDPLIPSKGNYIDERVKERKVKARLQA